MSSSELDQCAPMAAAPMKYQPDGSVDWGNMWDSFCVLAREGGPPHRGTMLLAQVTIGANTCRLKPSEPWIFRRSWRDYGRAG